MTTKPKVPKKRSHANTPRVTAEERVDAYWKWLDATPRPLAGARRRLIKAFGDHAAETLARYRRRARKATR